MKQQQSTLQAKGILTAVLLAVIPAFTSCKKAPPTGEAFITLKSNEVRYLADFEVTFYDSEFPDKLRTFQETLINDSRKEVIDSRKELAIPHNENSARISTEIEAHKNSKDSLIQKATAKVESDLADSKNKFGQRISQQRKSLDKELEKLDLLKKQWQEEAKNMRAQIKKNHPLYESLIQLTAPYAKKEQALVAKANLLADPMHKKGHQLFIKINKAIVDEKIAIPKLADGFTSVKVNARLPEQMIFSNSTPNLWRTLATARERYTERDWPFNPVTWPRHNKSHVNFFILDVRRGKSEYTRDDRRFDKITYDVSMSALFKNSKAAQAIIDCYRHQVTFKASIEDISKELKSNYKEMSKKVTISLNQKNLGESEAKAVLERYKIALARLNSVPANILAIENEKSRLSEQANLKIKSLEDSIASLTENTTQFSDDVKKEKEKELADFSERLTELTTELEESHEILDNIKKANDKIKKANSLKELKMYTYPAAIEEQIKTKIARFLSDEKMSSTRTDSKGGFSVPPKARYVMAYLPREATDEELFWLIKINLDEDQVRLSNSNVSNSLNYKGAADSRESLKAIMEVEFSDE